MKKAIVIIFATMFCLLVAFYCLDPGRKATLALLQEKGKTATKDYMLSSQSVTSIARDRRELVWIGTSAGVNVYDGKDYVQFGYDIKDTTALPDDYINVLHLDRKGRMWVGTQNGLARYVGGYRFHRIPLPSENDNIVAIEDSPEKHDSLAILVSDGNQTFHISGDEKITPSARHIEPNNLKAPLPEDHSILRKPVEVVSATFKDLGDNLWVGYRNAGIQVVSQNRIAYKKANDNLLSEKTKGIAVLSMATVGKHILASTALSIFIYDEQAKKIGQTPLRTIFDSLPAPRKINLSNMVKYDDQHAWLVSNHQVLSCRISNERVEVLHKSPVIRPVLGDGLAVDGHLYVSCRDGNLLRFRFDNLQPDTLRISSPHYTDDTEMVRLNNGDILLFMTGMHLAIFSPKTGKLKELKVAGMPHNGNMDPAFVRQDSYGYLWLGTMRDGLYFMDMKKQYMRRVDVLLNDSHIEAMVEDANRQVWVTTLRNAFFFTHANRTFLMNSLLSASQDQDDWQFYANSVCLSPDGSVVFGSSDGCKFMPPQAMNTDFLRTYVGTHASKMLNIFGLEVKNQEGKVLAVTDEVSRLSRYVTVKK